MLIESDIERIYNMNQGWTVNQVDFSSLRASTIPGYLLALSSMRQNLNHSVAM